jgi:hypothetical protein
MAILRSMRDALARMRGLPGRIRRRLGPGAAMNSFDLYVHSPPAAENALAIFTGEWASILPKPLDGFPAGESGLFDDGRIRWGLRALGGVADQRVLELGPLEGGHTYMLLNAGAKEVVAIEANVRAFLKCLVIKDALQLSRARFLCGDFIPYLRETSDRFDLVVASGVLYHLQNPIEAIEHISRVSDRAIIWTHYFEQAYADRHPHFRRRFRAPETASHAGFAFTAHRQPYPQDGLYKRFFGGNAAYSTWISKDDLLAGLRHFGFSAIDIDGDSQDHPQGPCLTIAASKRR